VPNERLAAALAKPAKAALGIDGWSAVRSGGIAGPPTGRAFSEAAL
jgi:hypothetical protein